MRWPVPEDDAELLGGVGACGMSGRKSDDAFEVMLLMQIDDGDGEEA